MRFSLCLALVPAAWAATLNGYTAPSSLLAKVEQDDSCNLPPDYQIKNFRARTNDTGEALSVFHFTFVDPTTEVTTFCQFNSSSESTTPGGLRPRYACNDRQTKFIWQDEEDQLWMTERVCPDPDG